MRRSAQRKHISGRKGFTLAELLVVVAIILILAGFGFVAVNRYQKRLKRVEMDNVAREIFVAAQNHLTASRAAGFWDGYVAQMEKDSSSGTDFGSALGKSLSQDGVGQDTSGNETGTKENKQVKRAHDVYAANQANRNAETSSGTSADSSDNVLKILLPYAAVDETLLTDGKYYVRYDAATASILDVYYTDKDTIPDYNELSSKAKDAVSYRTKYGVGWYGTAAITDTEAQSGLQAPVMAVRNAESLVVYIIDPNYKDFQSSVQLEVAQAGQDGKADKKSVVKNLKLNSAGNVNMGDGPLSSFVQVKRVTEADNKPITLADGSTAKDYMLYAVVLDSITRENGHFSQLFPELTAGADITVTATVSSEQASSDAKSSVTTNSLFEALNDGNALISNARHLENLSGDISALQAQVTTAEITDDLYWNGIRRTKKDGTKYAPYTGSAEAFIDAIRRADWKYGYQSLDTEDQGSDGSTAAVCVYSSDGEQRTDARKFAGIETATLQKLSGNDHVLTGFDIVADFAEAGDAANAAPSGAGLFASTGNSFEIDHLMVKNTRVYAAYSFGSSSAQLSAGTIVGNANGSVTLRNVSAVTDCIKDGEIYQAGTYNLTKDKSGLAAGSDPQASTVPLVDNQISGVYSRDGIAGGLVGTAGGQLNIENSFASVPVYSDASIKTGSDSGSAGNAGIAGGLVGKAAGGTITASFAGGYTDVKSTTSTSNDYSSTTINVAAPEGIAGGLIGAVTGNLNTTETYATTSVSASVGGGFIGMVSGGASLDLNKCYSTGRVFAKTEVKDHSGKFAGSVADNGSITSGGSFRAADASKNTAEVKNGVLAGTASSNGETSKNWTFPENLIGGETDIKKSNPDTLQEIPAEDLAAVAGNHDFKAENQTKETGVLTYAYNSSLKGKDYPYPSYTKTSDNSSITQFAGYTATGNTDTYKKLASIHYGDWVVLRSNESKGVELVNDAVLRADVVVPDDVDTVTYIIIGKTSGSVQQIAVKKTGQPNTDGIGKIQIKYLKTYRNSGQDWNNSYLSEDSSPNETKYQDSEHGAWASVSGQGTIISLFLDDLTTEGGQFADMCPVLSPGENISVVTVTGEKSLTLEEAKDYKRKYCTENWTNQKEEEKNTHAETSSLFGSNSALDGKEKGTVGFYKLDSGNIEITNLRHLQNLEGDISHFRDSLGNNEHINSGGFHAQQQADIDAARFGNMVSWIKDPRHKAGSYDDNPKKTDEEYLIWKYDAQSKTAFGKDNFCAIDNQWLMSYDGGNHTISRIKEEGNGERNGGLFATYYGETLENLTLDRFEIQSNGEAAGTLAGATESKNALRIKNVLSVDRQAAKSTSPVEVHSSVVLNRGKEETDSYAGGLIGKHDAQNPTLENCGAAVTVSGSASYAGGLVGGITKSSSVENCYAAGKTYEKHYQDQNGNTIYNVTGVKAAGGLIGYIAENLNGSKNNYATASVNATGSDGYAGGLIGRAEANINLEECYATGLVSAYKQDHAGLIAGSIPSGNLHNISYLKNINSADMWAVPGSNTNQYRATALNPNKASEDGSTYRYDKKLPDTYPYPMYASAGSSDGKKSHYGDWAEPLPPKTLDTKMTNDEVLYADLAPKKGETLPAAITVLVSGVTSGNYEQFVINLDSSKKWVESVSRTGWKSDKMNGSDNNQTLQQAIVSVTSEGKIRLILDDITGNGEQTFAKVCPSLLPGEDIKVVAFEDAQPLDQESLVSYSSVLDKAGQHNSLFADDSSIGSGSESGNNQQVVEVQANVAKNRHLQNLDTAVSGINSDSNGSDANASALTVSAAVLDNDLDWATFASTVQGIKGETSASSEYTFRGIQDSKLTSLDGNGKTISNLTIQDGNQSEKNSGLFRTVSTNLAVSNLTLKNPSVQTTDPNANAGGLVGMHSGETLTIDNVGVLYDDDSSAAITASDSNGNAGGLVGMSSSRLSITDSVVAGKNMAVTSGDSASAGGLVGAHSAGTLTISSSAAAVYVQGGLAAGGVIGSADSAQGSKITNTYAGGHTVNGFYENSQDGEGRFNVRATAQAGNAGGLIGSAANLTVSDSYATASVYSSNAAGGFIGQAKSGTFIQSSYCTGLVKGTNLAGTFCGDNQSSSGSPVENPDNLGNVYLSGVNYRLMPVCGNDSSSQEGDSSAKLAKPASYYELEEEATSGKASPFDSTLGTAYPFIQRAIINGIVHYGDWPARQNVKDQYVVTFHYQDPEQSNAWVAVPEIAYYGKVEPVKVPHSEGQTFLGWYDAENGGSRIPDEAFENVTADMDVYARTARYISFYQYNPVNGQYSLEAKQVTIATTSDGNETVELPAATSYLSDWAFDGWYTKQNGKGTKLGGARESIKLYPNTKTALEESDYKAYAHYTKLTKYTITLHFRNQMAGQTDQEAIEDLKAEWYQDLVFEQSNGTELLSSGELPKSNVDSDTSGNVSKVYKAVDKNGKKTVEILQENQDGVFADGILSVNTKTNRYSITCDKEDEYSDQDYYLIYGDSTEASYTVKHVFEDSKEETKALFDVSGKLAMDISEVSYVKGENFTYTETLKGSVGSYTTAAALMTQEEAKEAEKAGQKVDRNRVLPEDFSGFEPKGVILQKKIANNGTTVIEIHYVRKTYTLNYELNSGLITTDNGKQKSYKASETYEFGQTVQLPDKNVLTRKGYHLGTAASNNYSDKWAVVSKHDHDQRVQKGTEKYTAKDLFCNEELIMPAYNCYVIANWEANTTADIKIEIFQQKVTDQMDLDDDKKEYDFYTSTTVKKVDTTKTLTVPAIMEFLENAASDSSNPLPDSTNADSDTGYLSYDHFGFNSNKYTSENGESPKANPDGTTVIKLYYDRDIMHFVFNYGDYSEDVPDKQNQIIPVDVDPVIVWKVTVSKETLEPPVNVESKEFVEDPGTYTYPWGREVNYKEDSEYWVYLNGQYKKLSSYNCYIAWNNRLYGPYNFDLKDNRINFSYHYYYIDVDGKSVQLTKNNCKIGTIRETTKTYLSKYHYTWSSETYRPKHDTDTWTGGSFGHKISNADPQNVRYISAKNYAQYLKQTDPSENPISQYEDVTKTFNQLKRVEFSDVERGTNWQSSGTGSYFLGYSTDSTAVEVWRGLFDANFTNYKNSDGTLRYEWLHENTVNRGGKGYVYRPGDFSWKPGEDKYTTDILTTDILTKFSLAATFEDRDSVYSGPDRNYVLFTAVGEIATSGKYRVYHYLERDDSGRSSVNQTSGLTSDLFKSDPVNVIYLNDKVQYYQFDPLYTGYALYGYNREKSQIIRTATLEDSFNLNYQKPNLYGYYIRLPYSIQYASVKNMDPSTYLFKDSVKKLSVPNPENWPDTVDPDDVFDGWYDSSADNATQIADKDGNLTEDGKKLIAADNDHPGTMPSNNIQVFAHWKHVNREVTFNLNPGNRDGLDNVKVTYDYKQYTNAQSVEIEKGSSLTSLQAPDKDSIPAGEQFLYWYIVSDSNGEKTEIPIDRTFVINEDTTIYAKWAKDDMVTYTVRAMLYGENGNADQNLEKDVKSVVRGTSVTVKAPTVEGCRLVGGSKEGDYKLDEDTTFTFYYQKLPGAWEYTVRQYIEYTDIDDSSKSIRILFNQFTVPTTYRSVVVNAMDLLGKDADGKMQAQLEYEYASIDGQKTNQQTIQVGQNNKVAEFVYRPSTELLGESLVDVPKKTETYDGTAKTVEPPTINEEGKLLLKDIEGVSAKLSGEDQATYRRVNEKEDTDKIQLIHAGTYMETVPVQITYNNQTITVARISKVGLVIRPKDVIVTSRDAEIPYTEDGVYQLKDIEGVEVSNDGFVEPDLIHITYKWKDKPLQIGPVKNAFDCKLKGDNISDYNVTYKEGTLTVYWPLTVKHVLLYGPDTDADGKTPKKQAEILLDTTEMTRNTDKTVTVSPLNLNDTETHWYGLEVSKKSSDNNNWQVSYNSESNEYSLKPDDGKTEVKYSRYDAETHTYTVYYELPMLRGITVVGGDGNMTFQDPSQREYAQDYESSNEKLYAGAKLLVDMLNEAVSKQEIQDQSIMTRTTYSYRLESSMEGKKLSLNLIKTVKTYQDTDNNGRLSESEIEAQDQATDEASKPKVTEFPTELRSVTIDAQQTSSVGQEAPASSSP